MKDNVEVKKNFGGRVVIRLFLIIDFFIFKNYGEDCLWNLGDYIVSRRFIDL